MSPALRLLLPTKLEALFYLFLAFMLLTVLVAPDLWRQLMTSTHTDQQTLTAINLALKASINNVTRLSDPQIINAIIWGATAGIGMCIVGGLVHAAKVMGGDAATLHVRGGEVNFWTKLCVRLGASVALAVFVVLCISVILPILLRAYESRLASLTELWSNGLLATGAVVAAAACLYIMALLCRLIALRVRVFSEIYE